MDCSSFWVSLGAIGTVASAGVLIWYTSITSRLLLVTKAANEPFLTLTYDPNAQSLYLRNLGASPALDATVTIESMRSDVQPSKILKSTYARPAVSAHGDTRLQKSVTAADLDGRRFRISFRDRAGTKHAAPAPLVGDANASEMFRWEFETE